MHHDFWHERWRTREIGFHQSSPHPFLERWWPTLSLEPGSRVYVPLCGKSLDMVWLAVRGHEVVGTELSGIAAQEFFGEQGTSAHVQPRGPFRRHAAGAYEILEGDAFGLTAELLGPVGAAYDRAALVALPPDLRPRYVQTFASVLPAATRALLVAFEYPQQQRNGPPFSVRPDEVLRLYGEFFDVQELERVSILDESPKFRDAGVSELWEVAYRLRRK